MKGRVESSPDHSVEEEFKSKDFIEELNNVDYGDSSADTQPEAIINERMLNTTYRLQTIKEKRRRLRSLSAPMQHDIFSMDNFSSDKKTRKSLSTPVQHDIFSTNNFSSDKKIRKSSRVVRFSTVEVREYAMILGDNPAVSLGPSITLDWTPFSRAVFDVERYIVMNPEPRRKIGEMVMPLVRRKLLIKKSGYSRREMLASTKQTNIVRAQRLATVRKLQLVQMEDLAQRMKSRMKLTFSRKKKDKGNLIQILPVA